MNSPARRSPPDKRKRVSRATFSGVTVVAVIMAAILVGLAVVSSSAPKEYTPTPDPTSPGETTKGSPDAPITIIEYSDFQCAVCQEFALTVEPQLEAAYVDTGKARWIFKFTIGHGDESLLADEAAACAAEQGQFWAYYYLLMQQRARPSVDDLSVEKLQSLAQQLGLDMETFNASLLGAKYYARVKQDDQECRELGITGTPVFFINGTRLDGARSLKDFQEIMDPILEGSGS